MKILSIHCFPKKASLIYKFVSLDTVFKLSETTISQLNSLWICVVLDFDTDEETDQLLEKQYQGNQYVDIPELTQPPVNRSAQVRRLLLAFLLYIETIQL